MSKISVFLNNQVDQKPWIETNVEALPRKGDEFEMENGKLYKVDSVRFVPQKSGNASIQVWLVNPEDSAIESS